ncbi:MAG: 30S ribosomal protein S12 methylthiotransferase RimO [Clostridia bacterium]|nr:30S ribosomal protein S12 methylthiotransferase RimO [Clostridia bacterium]
MNKKIGFISLGCAKNLTDTETMLGILSERGFEITADASLADVIVVNTCAFIDSAKEESINAILEMAAYKEDKCELLIVAGCLAQRYSDDILTELPEVDLILGTTDYARIAEVIEAYYEDGEKISSVSDENKAVSYDLPRVQSTPAHTAYLKIADGCDNFCTYCIIPKLRGKFRSRPMASILSEARSLAEHGVKELILVAQDTACYGKDTGGGNLAELLASLGKIDGIEWIRLQYCYPENITDELIGEIASNPKVVKYLDMPIQHISDNILKKMGRRSRGALVRSLIDSIRQRIPSVVIRTSLIVGFPGETEADFEELTYFLMQYRLDKVGIFTYSREEGTPAYDYDGQISEDIKEDRRSLAMTIQKEVSHSINSERIGKTDTVIIEGYDADEYCYVGRCSGDTPEVDAMAYVYSEDELSAGDIVSVEIVDASDYDVMCKCVDRTQIL